MAGAGHAPVVRAASRLQIKTPHLNLKKVYSRITQFLGQHVIIL